MQESDSERLLRNFITKRYFKQSSINRSINLDEHTSSSPETNNMAEILQVVQGPEAMLKDATSSDGFEMVQQKPAVLFSSKEGISLPTEISLKIVEEVVGSNPKVGSATLKALSKVCNSGHVLHRTIC